MSSLDSGIVLHWMGEEGPQPGRLRLAGRDNSGCPRQHFADSLAASDDRQFIQTAEDRIWLSAYASNNPRSDYHWQADACYDEAQRRGNPALYTCAYDQARASAGL